MEKRTAKIKTIVQNPPKKDGTKSIAITFDDDKFGVFLYKDAHELSQGQEITYEFTEEKSKKGNLYHNISTIVLNQLPETEDKPPKTNVYLDVAMREEVRKEKYECNQLAMSLAIGVYKEGNIDSEKTVDLFNTIKTALFDTVDEISIS